MSAVTGKAKRGTVFANLSGTGLMPVSANVRVLTYRQRASERSVPTAVLSSRSAHVPITVSVHLLVGADGAILLITKEVRLTALLLDFLGL